MPKTKGPGRLRSPRQVAKRRKKLLPPKKRRTGMLRVDEAVRRSGG